MWRSADLIVIGAANVPEVYVAFFEAVNTVIEGLLAYLKGKGQPYRARTYLAMDSIMIIYISQRRPVIG